MKYHTQWQVRALRNKKARGRKISGIEPMPGEDKVTKHNYNLVGWIRSTIKHQSSISPTASAVSSRNDHFLCCHNRLCCLHILPWSFRKRFLVSLLTSRAWFFQNAVIFWFFLRCHSALFSHVVIGWSNNLQLVFRQSFENRSKLISFVLFFISQVLITSNDSRIRLYDLKDNSLYCKYKGSVNGSSQIKASFRWVKLV